MGAIHKMRLDHTAAQTWNSERSLDETNKIIHDGVSGDDALAARASGYVNDLLFGRFPQAVPEPNAYILEIGSGVGWIMEAMAHHLEAKKRTPKEVVGLDIAPRMIALAQERIGGKQPFGFILYDGVSIPLDNAMCDLVYSVAALQHIPRHFVFNLFFEIHRILKPDGFSVLHLMSTDALQAQEKHHPWREEITNQINGANAHWHHFYTAKELEDVLRITGFRYAAVNDDRQGTLVCCMSKAQLSLPRDFDPKRYLALNPDVAKARDKPETHWLTHGHKEGRRWR